jgi:hypothetical protein
MQKVSEVFKSNFKYCQRVAHKKVILEKCPLSFSGISIFDWWTFLEIHVLQ